MTNKLRVYHLLSDNPHWVEVIKEAFEVERQWYEKYPQHKFPDMAWLGFEWHQVHTPPTILNKMVAERILDVSYSSHSSKNYKVADPEAVKEVMALLESPPEPKEEIVTDIPNDIFQPIIGYDDIKEFLLKALKGEKRLHFLFEGSPATAKSLFMLCVQRAIPQAYYATGSRTTAPGLTDALLSRQPRVLLLDEIDKMDMPSYAVLLSLMESGNVVETKYKRHTVTQVNTVVIGAANSTTKLPTELLSRFDFHLRLKPYTRDEFITVCQNYLSQFEGVPEDLAEYIGVKVWTSLKIPSDVRKARGIARILDRFDQTEVDRVIAFEEKYH
jgi:Holliday junction DNA helicase RuvB